MSRDTSTFQERLVDKLVNAQTKQFKKLQSLVKREIAETNRRIDDLIDDDSDGHQIVSDSEEPPRNTELVLQVYKLCHSMKNHVLDFGGQIIY